MTTLIFVSNTTMEHGKMEVNSVVTGQGDNLQLIEIRKVKTDFASTNDYLISHNVQPRE